MATSIKASVEIREYVDVEVGISELSDEELEACVAEAERRQLAMRPALAFGPSAIEDLAAARRALALGDAMGALRLLDALLDEQLDRLDRKANALIATEIHRAMCA